jgi:hypothetical protein
MAEGTVESKVALAAELKKIGSQFLVAIVRFAMLLSFIVMHWILLQATSLIVGEGWHRARSLLEVLFYVAFIVLYLDQLFEMLAVFIPRLTGLRQRITGGQNTEGGGVAA